MGRIRGIGVRLLRGWLNGKSSASTLFVDFRAVLMKKGSRYMHLETC
jgi:hypothetical protein